MEKTHHREKERPCWTEHGGNNHLKLRLCMSSCQMSNYELSEIWTQPDRDPAGADRSCFTGGSISFFCPSDDKPCRGACHPGWLNTCSGIRAPDIQKKAESGGWFDTARWPRKSFVLSFFATGGKRAAGVPSFVARCEKLQPQLDWQLRQKQVWIRLFMDLLLFCVSDVKLLCFILRSLCPEHNSQSQMLREVS